ncbi:hypothetical protein C1H46_005900 [Malus baccata]|uniref:CCHC-type domain-containing protein n=1 Tax=Malus baccata TaxID=106549 RepID=A0A540NBK4_MALBA|nr:hypothetical protein C1H46_005900 [Malus baccata]
MGLLLLDLHLMVFLSPMVCLNQMLFLGYSFHGNNFGPSNTTNFNGQGNRSFGNNNGYKGKGNGGYKPRFNGNINGQFWAVILFIDKKSFMNVRFALGKVIMLLLIYSDGGQVVQECQICGKRGHIAIDCRYMGDYAYQRAHPSSFTVHYAFQYLSSQFQHPNSFANVMLPGGFGLQGVSPFPAELYSGFQPALSMFN